MATRRGFLYRKNIYLVSIDLQNSVGREGDYLTIDQRLKKIGFFARPTMQIRVLVHRGNAAVIRNALRAERFLRGPRKGQHILQPNDRIFVMKLQKSAAWNRLKESNLTKAIIGIYS